MRLARALPLPMLASLLAGSAAGSQPAPATPEVFAPGIITRGAHEAAPTFTPDGQTVYFQRSTPGGSAILVSHCRDGAWSDPGIAAFSGQWNDMEPALSPDGSFLVFVSSRPIEPGGQPIDGYFNGEVRPGAGGNLWRVRRIDHGWSEPERLPETINSGTSIFAPAILRDGTILFMRPDETTKKFRLFESRPTPQGYEDARPLPFSTGETTDVDPAAEPDGQFIVFGSGRSPAKSIDLFIVRREQGAWGEPRHLGTSINSPGSDAEPRLSPDGTRLYYSSERLVPTRFPRSRAEAEREMEAAALWNNGLYNIWTVDLRPWLGGSPPGPQTAAGAEPRSPEW